jgi:hypothetical protein
LKSTCENTSLSSFNNSSQNIIPHKERTFKIHDAHTNTIFHSSMKKQLSKSMPHTCDGTLRKTTIYKTMSYGKKGKT